MQPMPHQLMGYDRAITMFSPDGRLLQVEYAKKTVKQGSTAIGMVCSDGILLVTDKRIIEKLIRRASHKALGLVGVAPDEGLLAGQVRSHRRLIH